MEPAVHMDDAARVQVIAALKAKLSEWFLEVEKVAGNTLLKELYLAAIERLNSLSTELLLELGPHDGNAIVGFLADKDSDETLIREYIMYFPTARAIMDVRRALGRENLLTDVEEERRGIMSTMRVSHASYIINRKRGTFDDPAPEPETFVTVDVARLVVAAPHREQEFIDYMTERDVIGDEIDLPSLREYLEVPSGLARGTL